ncbi:WD_REPEATS_REGION domain-containing protein, partial [Haematococcus lacustris]
MARGSNSASRVGVDTLSSIRSSFAVDVCPNNSDGPVGPQALKTLNTHARLQQEPSVVPDGSCRMAFQPPAQLLASYQALGIVPPDMPVPLTMLATLWRQPSPDAARAVAHKLRDLGVMRIASLEDGSAWCLVAPHHLQACQDSYAELLPGYHAALLDGYTCNGALKLKDVADDGYFMQAVAHHLVHANRLELLHGLLCEPLWLEAKLHAYGIAPVVADFRKYLSRREDADIKLLLQALQLSLGCCMDQPTAKMLREQMLGRLLLHGLLCEPLWLEAKLHAYGIAPVVADFRKYLSRREDADIKLLLQALQLSLGCCMDQPTAKMLREQMLGRL